MAMPTAHFILGIFTFPVCEGQSDLQQWSFRQMLACQIYGTNAAVQESTYIWLIIFQYKLVIGKDGSSWTSSFWTLVCKACCMPLQEEQKNYEFFLLSIFGSMVIFQVADKLVCAAVGVL